VRAAGWDDIVKSADECELEMVVVVVVVVVVVERRLNVR
jgi:hypothetical protein